MREASFAIPAESCRRRPRCARGRQASIVTWDDRRGVTRVEPTDGSDWRGNDLRGVGELDDEDAMAAEEGRHGPERSSARRLTPAGYDWVRPSRAIVVS